MPRNLRSPDRLMNARLLTILLGCLAILGCRDKSAGPAPVLPQNGTYLFLANCDPFNTPPGFQESVTLVADPNLACTGDVDYHSGTQASWTSGVFSVSAGTYSEGVHLVFDRPLNESQLVASFDVTLRGVASSFTRQIDLGVGVTHSVTDLEETGTLARDTTGSIRLTITVRNYAATLKIGGLSNTYVITEAKRSNLCELYIDKGLSNGFGQPNTGLNFALRNASVNAWDSVLYDFSRGVLLDHTSLHFGPQSGPVYVVAGDGHCRDTAAFWATAPAAHFVLDTLRPSPTDEPFFAQGSIISDGVRVWFIDLYQPQHDSIPCRVYRVREPGGFPRILHPVYDCHSVMSAEYDQNSQLIWIVSQSSTEPDSAWGYTINGALDSIVTGATIPSGHLYQGNWVQEVGHDNMRRQFNLVSLNGGGTSTLGTYPVELTEFFGGTAGIGLPGAAGNANYTINAFNDQGNWIASYPVLVGQYDQLWSVAMISADNIIIYSVTGLFPPFGAGQQVRVLRP
jgi:hypothetical protein